MRKVIRFNSLLVFTLILASQGCSKKDDSSDTEEAAANAPKPGALMVTMDTAMGSIGFAGQSAAASLNLIGDSYDADWTTDAWQLAHCKPRGGAVLEAYQSDRPVAWGCLLAVKTDGPDTPRGGTGRIVSVSCAMDKAISAGSVAVDGQEHSFKLAIDEECWGADFVAMAKEQLPQLVNAATGNPEVDAKMTAYTEAPSSWTSVQSKWKSAYDIVFGFGDGTSMEYKMLLYSDSTTMAASILSTSTDSEKIETFAMSLTNLASGDAEFRYEGRFPYGKNGDDTYGSNHTRVVVSGPYKDGTFTKITSGEGYEAAMYGDKSTGAITSGQVKTFKANSDGIGTIDFPLDVTGVLNGSSSAAWGGTTGSSPNVYSYTSTDDQKASVLTTDVKAFTGGADWHKANGPLSYTSAVISD